GELLTPHLGSILDGITRDTVLRIARAEGIVAREVDLAPEALRGADEVFLTSTSLAIGPVGGVDGRVIGAQTVGPVTARVRARLRSIMSGEDESFAWMLRSIPGAHPKTDPTK